MNDKVVPPAAEKANLQSHNTILQAIKGSHLLRSQMAAVSWRRNPGELWLHS